jgi:hypothetical protein
MQNPKVDQLIHQMENYLECWKQFNNFMNLARAKKYSPEDDLQFLEVKSVIVQELELILSALEVSSPTREEVHTLIGSAPSLRYLADLNEANLRNLETQWHKIYIGWHAILGQLKVREREDDNPSGLSAMFAKKKK